MPANENTTPQRRFLIRGSMTLAAMLLLWWLTLVNPLLALLRVCAGLPLGCLPGAAEAAPIRVMPAGDWVVRVPMPARWIGQSTDGAGPKYRGVVLHLPQASLVLYTLGFPIFWGVILASPKGWRMWKVLFSGTAMVTLTAVLQVLVFIGYTIPTNLHLISNSLATWFARYISYVNVYLISYTAPFCIALWLHKGLRSEIFPGNSHTAKPGAPASETAGIARRPSSKSPSRQSR